VILRAGKFSRCYLQSSSGVMIAEVGRILYVFGLLQRATSATPLLPWGTWSEHLERSADSLPLMSKPL
jgi:hypothetical protein